MTYDALNRLQSRTLSAVVYRPLKVGIASFLPNTVPENAPYPREPIAVGLTAVPDTVIGATTESFTCRLQRTAPTLDTRRLRRLCHY